MVGLGRVYLWDQRQWWKSLILGPAWGVGGGLEDSMSGGRVTVVGVRSGMGCRVLSGDISKGSWPVSAPSHWPDLRELGAKLGEFLMEDRRCRKVQEGIQYKNRETCVCVWVCQGGACWTALVFSQIKNVERQVVVAGNPGEQPPLLPITEQEVSLRWRYRAFWPLTTIILLVTFQLSFSWGYLETYKQA